MSHWTVQFADGDGNEMRVPIYTFSKVHKGVPTLNMYQGVATLKMYNGVAELKVYQGIATLKIYLGVLTIKVYLGIPTLKVHLPRCTCSLWGRQSGRGWVKYYNPTI